MINSPPTVAACDLAPHRSSVNLDQFTAAR